MDTDKYLEYTWEQVLSALELPGPFKRRASGRLYVNCVFHNEKTPSLVLYPESSRRFQCYGCGANGDLIKFICKYKEVELADIEDFFKYYVPGTPGLGEISKNQKHLFPEIAVGEFCFWKPRPQILAETSSSSSSDEDIPF